MSGNVYIKNFVFYKTPPHVSNKDIKEFKLVGQTLKGGYLIKKDELIENSIELNALCDSWPKAGVEGFPPLQNK